MLPQTKISPQFSEQYNILEHSLDALIQMGAYPNREAILQEAFTLFLQAHPQERLAIAIQLYTAEVVSLARAAELAGLNFFDFEAILRARGLEILTPDETSAEIEQGIALILGE